MATPAADAAATLSIDADAREFARASAWLDSTCRARGVPPEQVHGLDICLTEALANVVAHGGPGALRVPIELALLLRGTPSGGSAQLTVSAGGVEFDPGSHRPRPAPASLDDAEPGGLGIVMMRAYSDQIVYRREGQRNITRFVVGWTAGPTA